MSLARRSVAQRASGVSLMTYISFRSMVQPDRPLVNDYLFPQGSPSFARCVAVYDYHKYSNNRTVCYVIGVAISGMVGCFFCLAFRGVEHLVSCCVFGPYSKVGNSQLHSTRSYYLSFYGMVSKTYRIICQVSLQELSPILSMPSFRSFHTFFNQTQASGHHGLCL